MTEPARRNAHVAENGTSAYAVDISVSGFQLVGDEPAAEGGADLGPAPYDYLLAALGECTAMTIRWYAKRQNWPLEKVEVHLTHHKPNDENGKPGRADHFSKRIIIHGESLSDEQRAKLVEISAKCPVQRTLESVPVITTLA